MIFFEISKSKSKHHTEAPFKKIEDVHCKTDSILDLSLLNLYLGRGFCNTRLPAEVQNPVEVHKRTIAEYQMARWIGFLFTTHLCYNKM